MPAARQAARPGGGVGGQRDDGNAAPAARGHERRVAENPSMTGISQSIRTISKTRSELFQRLLPIVGGVDLKTERSRMPMATSRFSG